MSDLQIGLVALGVALIFLVVVFNWWQDHRIRRKMQDTFPEAPEDTLMAQLDTQRREPTVRIAETLADKKTEPAIVAEEIDSKTEAVIDVTFSRAVLGTELIKHLKTYLRVDTKPVRLFATTSTGENHAYPHQDESYVAVLLVVLLANRQGPLNEIDWSRVWTAAEGLASQVDGSVDGPDSKDVIAKAQHLDAVCAGLDAQVGIYLQLAEPMAVDDAREFALTAGFMEYGSHLAWLASSGLPRFNLLFDGKAIADLSSTTIERLDLVIDLPNSPKDEQAFSRMASVGRDLAIRLDADLIDDQGQPITDHHDQVIDKQLYDLYQQLEQAGFVAGERSTQRVFS